MKTTQLLIITFAVIIFSVANASAQQTVDFDDQGKARTEANLEAGSKITYTVPGEDGYYTILLERLQSNEGKAFYEVKTGDKTISKGKINSRIRFKSTAGSKHFVTVWSENDMTGLSLNWRFVPNRQSTSGGSANSSNDSNSSNFATSETEKDKDTPADTDKNTSADSEEKSSKRTRAERKEEAKRRSKEKAKEARDKREPAEAKNPKKRKKRAKNRSIERAKEKREKRKKRKKDN